MSAAFPADLAEAIRAERSAAIERLGAVPTLWLAAVPMWTRDAAEAAGFPVPSVNDFVRQARSVGWCETSGSLDVPVELDFWMPDEVRRDVIDLLARRAKPAVATVARQIAASVLRLGITPRSGARRSDSSAPATLPPATLLAWAELMSAKSPELALIERVRQAVEAEDLGGAQKFVMAGEALAPLLAGTAELALDRARRLLSLGARRRQDRRALGRYLDRPELSGAVSRLLEPGGQRWALHLRGAGGVGKTMLIRYLASGRYAADRDLPGFPVARVDFDHIGADYPVRRPVQLLVELSDELALHAATAGRADRALRAFRDIATSAHEALSDVREENATALRNPLVLGAVDAFAAVLESLPGTLLILDTCEELAKADAGNPEAPAVRATFAILERLRAGAPSARVLFAGRRPLPARDYLAVGAVAGFTVDEARWYLTVFSSRPLAPALVDAMIRQSAAVDADVPPSGELPSRISPFDLALFQSWADEDPGLDERRVGAGSDAYVEGRIIERLRDPLVRAALPALAAIGRCRVATLASFVTGDARSAVTLGARLADQEWIDADGDPPVRVTARPALARRLRHYFGAPGRAAGFAVVTARLAESLAREIRERPLAEIDVDELLAALRLSGPAAAAELWEDIAERTAAPPGHWGWMLNVTSRVLGESEDERWPSADALRATVLAASIAASRRDSASFIPRDAWAEVRAWADRHPDPVQARILRARAALGLLPHAPDDESLWSDVGQDEPGGKPPRVDPPPHVAEDESPPPHPAGPQREGLEEQPARGNPRMPVPPPESIRVNSRPLPGPDVLAASAVDAADRLLELGAAAAAARLFELSHLRAAQAGEAGPRVRAWALVALGRLRADSDPSAALNALAQAEGAFVEPPWSGSPPGELTQAFPSISRAIALTAEPVWPDWIPPEDLLARVRIEHGLAGRGLLQPPGPVVLDEWEAYAAVGLGGIDRERLASLCLRLRLDEGSIEPSELDRWEELDRHQPGRVPTCSAHDLVPPLRVTLAEGELAAGRPERALAMIERRRDEILGSRGSHADVATLRTLDEATVRIARRMRLDDQVRHLTQLGKPGSYLGPSRLNLQDSACRALAVIIGIGLTYDADGKITERPASWHAWFQCQRVLPTELPIPRWDPDGTGTDLAPDIELDLEELRWLGLKELGRLVHLVESRQRTDHPRLADLERAFSSWLARPRRDLPPARSPDPFGDVRVALRRMALGDVRDCHGPGDYYGTRAGAPKRRIAEIAFDEAELLALRLPSAAARLFREAMSHYADVNDHVGLLMAAASLAAIPEATGPPGTAGSLESLGLTPQAPMTPQVPVNVPGVDTTGALDATGVCETATGVRETAERSVVRDALNSLRGRNPDVAEVLTGPPEAAGPWRWWAALTQRVLAEQTADGVAAPDIPLGPAGQSAPAHTRATGPGTAQHASARKPPADRSRAVARATRRSRAGRWTLFVGVVLVLGAIAGGLGIPLAGTTQPHPGESRSATGTPAPTAGATPTPGAGATATPIRTAGAGATPTPIPIADAGPPGRAATPTPTMSGGSAPLQGGPPVGWFIVGSALFILTLIALMAVRLPRVFRLADGRGIGVLRLGSLDFVVRYPLSKDDYLKLTVGPRDLRGAPKRQRARLALTWPAVRLVRLVRPTRRRNALGYSSFGSPRDRLVWSTLPEVSARWWRRGADAAAGTIHCDDVPAGEPWERKFSGGLGPAAAGRIEWARLLYTGSTPFPDNKASKVAADGPLAWRRRLDLYDRPSTPDEPARIRHAVGTAVHTSAGPRLDVAGSTERSPVLLGAELLARGRPTIVVLQADPIPIDDFAQEDDSPPAPARELLELAAELVHAGVPAVLVLPPIRDDMLGRVVETIGRHVTTRRGDDARLVNRKLRRALKPYLRPADFDDFVLFLHRGRYS